MNSETFPIVEIFFSIQGEGRYAGTPSLFIRLAKCNRKCEFCDTEIEKIQKTYSLEEMIEELRKYSGINIIWTGGETILHWESIKALYELGIKISDWHIETNGDLINKKVSLDELAQVFDYIVISPKCLETAKRIHNLLVEDGELDKNRFEIKVVTDLNTINMDLIKYATSLMPLTSKNIEQNQQIRQKVVKYCIENNIRYTDRLQVILWGFKTKGV